MRGWLMRGMGLMMVLAGLLLGVCGCEDGKDDNPSTPPAMDVSGVWRLDGILERAWQVQFDQDEEGRVSALIDDGTDWWTFTGWYVAPDTINGRWEPKNGGQAPITVRMVVMGNQMRGDWGQGMWGGPFTGTKLR